jgi:hypothetical protein
VRQKLEAVTQQVYKYSTKIHDYLGDASGKLETMLAEVRGVACKDASSSSNKVLSQYARVVEFHERWLVDAQSYIENVVGVCEMLLERKP